MQKQGIMTKLLVLGVGVTALGLVLLTSSTRKTSGFAFTGQERTSNTEDDKKMPIAVFSASLPTDSTERAIRLARSNRYNKRHTVPFDETSPDTTARSSINEWYLYVSALPTAESDAVVLGKVVAAKGYLSNDKTGAYSEFTILVEEVFNVGRRSLMAGSSVDVEREGASVKLPDGRVIRYWIGNQGMPQIDRRYMLFLKYNEQGDDYRILTAYELRKGRVSPLDEAEHFAAYKDSDEERFLNAVRQAIGHPPRAPRENGRLNQ